MLSTELPEKPAPQNQPWWLRNGASRRHPRSVFLTPCGTTSLEEEIDRSAPAVIGERIGIVSLVTNAQHPCRLCRRNDFRYLLRGLVEGSLQRINRNVEPGHAEWPYAACLYPGPEISCCWAAVL